MKKETEYCSTKIAPGKYDETEDNLIEWSVKYSVATIIDYKDSHNDKIILLLILIINPLAFQLMVFARYLI